MIVLTGLASAVPHADPSASDPTRFLRSRKSRKYMGVQDDLAVVAAGRALESAGLAGAALGERAGLFVAVGYIPFEEGDIRPVLEASIEDGRFSMERFAGGGYEKAHPLLTFRCLPNMPAYHVSANFDVQGPYLVTYPGAGQMLLAIEEACAALGEGRAQVAIVCGVAHQRNFLVEHHFGRLAPPVGADRLRDAGATMVLETEGHARERGASVRGVLTDVAATYAPFDPREARSTLQETFIAADAQWDVHGEVGRSGDARHVPSRPPALPVNSQLGPASPIVLLESAWRAGARAFAYEVRTRDGIAGRVAVAREAAS